MSSETTSHGGEHAADQDASTASEQPNGVLEARLARAEDLLEFLMTRVTGIIVLIGILSPMATFKIGNTPISATLITMPFRMASATTENEPYDATYATYLETYLAIPCLIVLLVVAVACCARLLFFSGDISRATVVLTWIFIVGTLIATAFMLFLNTRGTADGAWSLGPGLWTLLGGAVLTALLVLPPARRGWFNGYR